MSSHEMHESGSTCSREGIVKEEAKERVSSNTYYLFLETLSKLDFVHFGDGKISMTHRKHSLPSLGKGMCEQVVVLFHCVLRCLNCFERFI